MAEHKETSYYSINSDSYKNHPVFTDIEFMMNFYDNVSFSSFRFVPSGTLKKLNFASNIFSALQGTLESIKLLLKAGRITDAYTLTRKYFDDILVDIYIDITIKDKYDWENNYIVEDVEVWLKGKHEIPRMKRLLQIIKDSKSTKDLFPYFGWYTYLKKNRELLDDNVHSNMYRAFMINCSSLTFNRKTDLQNISILLKQFFTIHLSFIFHLNGQYLMASDYFDYMDCNEIPPTGSDSWLASYGQKAFDKYIKPHSKLAAYIKETCALDIQ